VRAVTKPNLEPEQLDMLASDPPPARTEEKAAPAVKKNAKDKVATKKVDEPDSVVANPGEPLESPHPDPLPSGERETDGAFDQPADPEREEELDDEEIDDARAATLRPSPVVEFKPAAEVLPTLRPWQDICAGVVLAGAIGDAMGHPTEFIGSMESIHKKYGPQGVTKFELYWDRGGKRFAPYTDDTQMAEAVLRSLLESREAGADLDATMTDMADRFIEWSHHPQGGHRAPGNACLSGCRALEGGAHWSKGGGPTAGGCGSVMRAYPFGLFFAHDLKKAEHWAVEHSRLTHNDPIALAACAAMAVGVARLARGEHPRTVTAEMVGAACRYSPLTAAMMATAIDEARKGIGPEVTLDRLRAWAAHEAIAAAVYLLERHPDDPQAAILEGANTPGDSDSIATLGGALLGARCGARALPAEWVRDVERADELLALALEI
jgi:ADP-ribosylglycohydrolase